MKPASHNLAPILLSLFLCCTACSKAPPAATVAIPATVSATEQHCEQLDELMKMALSYDLFDLSAEEFIAKYKNLIQVQADEIDSLLDPRKTRGITFTASKGNWLTGAKTVYMADADNLTHMTFFTGYFGINQSCISNSQELDTRLSKFIPTSKDFSPDDKKENFWYWDTTDPQNITMGRHIIFKAEETGFSMETWQHPISKDGEEEGAYD